MGGLAEVMEKGQVSMNRSTLRILGTVVALVFFCLLIDALRPMLAPFIVGALVAYLFDPLADRLERLGLSRTVVTALITAGVFGTLIVAVVSLGPMLAEQASALAKALPPMIDSAKAWLRDHADEWLAMLQVHNTHAGTQAAGVDAISESISERAYGAGAQVVSRVASSGVAIINMAALLVITPVVCFYLIRDYDRIIAHIDGLLPLKYRDTIREQARAVDATLAAYLRGQIEVMLILATYYAITLVILGVPYALIIALVSGSMILIPYLGTIISTGLALGVAYSHGDAGSNIVLWTLVIYGIAQVLEGQILVPNLIGEHVGLHPLWILFGLLAGGTLFGFVGVLLAVPMTAVIGVLTKFAVKRYRESSLYQEQ